MQKMDFLVQAQSQVFKALGHKARLLIVQELSLGSRCVCDLQRLVGSDMSTISKHLSVLKHAGIVSHEKQGTNVVYSLEMICVENFLECTRLFITKQIQGRQESLPCEAAICLEEKCCAQGGHEELSERYTGY